jgi:predicted nucleotidyltransferase
MEPRIPLDPDRIRAFCEKWKIVEFALFGSVLTDAFRDDSDVDVMVQFDEPSRWSLHHLDEMEDELTAIFGHRADLSTKPGIVHMPNYIRSNSILRGSQVIYAA